MYFKKLELYGFKSFADKTLLHFEPGVTAVVGPNGCGKSNVADGIRWVLGEQSAKSLRGSKMEDVIFNGSDKKEPINFAEVSLTLSNHSKILPIDYEEVTITRRVFRTGESEYFLNKSPVRLRDIAELFMGTGLGETSYSLIEQGKIDLILSSKPEERRSVFEEASGITKYKAKKREALRKLEDTENNLVRVNDIILEVKRQINSLERQAQKAQRYKEEFENLKSFEVKLGRFELDKLSKETSSINKEEEILREKESSFIKDLEGLEIESGKLRQSIEEVERDLTEARSKAMRIDSSIDKNADRMTMDKERVIELKGRIAMLDSEREALSKKLVSMKALLEERSKEDSQALAEYERMSKAVEIKGAALEERERVIKEGEAFIQNAKAKLLDMMQQQTRAKNELLKNTSQLQNSSVRQRRLLAEKDKSSEDASLVDLKLSAVQSEYEEAVRQLEEANAKHSELASLAEAARAEIEALSIKLNSAKETIALSSSKVEVLEEQRAHYEGFSSGVKSLLMAKEEGKFIPSGTFYPVASLLDVLKGREWFIELALGENCEAIVVDYAPDAHAAIEYIRNNNIGKVKFILLDSVNSAVGAPRAIGSGFSINWLSNFVKVGEKYQGVLNYLFEGIAFAADMKSGLDLLKSEGALKKVVTEAGEVLDGSSISFGATQSVSYGGLIGRESQIKELRDLLEVSKTEAFRLEELVRVKKEEAAVFKTEALDLGKTVRELEVSLSSKKAKMEGVELEKKRLNEELSIIGLELDEIGSELNEIKEKDAALKGELSSAEDKAAALQAQVNGVQNDIGLKAKEREGLLVEITRLKTELSLAENKKEEVRNALAMLKSSVESDEASLSGREKDRFDSHTKIGELEVEVSRLEIENKDLVGEREALDIDIEQIEARRKDYLRLSSEVNDEMKKAQGSLEAARNTLRDLEVKNAGITYKVTSLKERISQTYKLSLEDTEVEAEAKVEVLDGASIEKLTQDIAMLKKKLDNMGPVNLVAIEEHEELKNRYTFLTTQQTDLVNAKDQLIKAIAKINRTTKELFLDTFQKVQAAFKEYFRMLFNGGDGELVLLEEEDVLECGIEIIVRPPGKKLQNVSLLSGGEKAMTAISLLFAIFKVKPSPFCVLDEIDAPLDESNVDRFTKVLKEFITASQFIIITHNKKTMAMADVMYGITMEQSGVSKIVSVKFGEKKQAAG